MSILKKNINEVDKNGNTALISLFLHWGGPRSWAGAMARAEESTKQQFERKYDNLNSKLQKLTLMLQNPDVDTRIQNKKGKTAKMFIEERKKYDLAFMRKNKWDKKKFRNKIIDKYKQIVKTLYTFRRDREQIARLVVNRIFNDKNYGPGVARHIGDKVTKDRLTKNVRLIF
mgnify:FL=1